MYSPPACGFIAPSSAYVRAPQIESRPPMIQAANTSLTEPTACIISVGTRKMPLPMTIPTTTAAAWLVVRRRASSGRDTTEGKTVVDVVIGVDNMGVRVVLRSLQEIYLAVKN